jgi:putative membrane protein
MPFDSVPIVAADVDPDARFLLANERTLLAWIRTSITLQAAGFGIVHFATTVTLNGLIGAAVLAVGALCGLVGYSRYRAADRAIRRGELPPPGAAPEIIALGVVLLSVLLVAVTLTSELGN